MPHTVNVFALSLAGQLAGKHREELASGTAIIIDSRFHPVPASSSAVNHSELTRLRVNYHTVAS